MSVAESKAVFLSYASQDAEAARKICEALRVAGVEVWFDQSELVGGDAWDAKIRKQIKECTLLIPIISAATQARTEGYFRLEWRLADQRTHLMAKGRPFLLPVVIDDTRDADAHVPDSFTEVQWTKAPDGVVAPTFVARVKKLLGGAEMEAGRPRPAAETQNLKPRTENRRLGRLWWALPILGVIIALLLVMRRKTPETPVPSPAAAPGTPSALAAPATAGSLVSAQPREFPRDPDLKRVHQLIHNVVDGIAEDFALADDLVKPKLAARPNDPEVVTVAAELAQEFVTRGIDASPARRAQAQRLTERAVQLAPDNPEALAVLGYYLYSTGTQPGRAEDLLRRAIALNPKEPRFYCSLYQVLAAGDKPAAEVDAFGARMTAAFPEDAMAAYVIAKQQVNRGDLAGAEASLDKTLALAPLPTAIIAKARVMLEVHGDIGGMKRVLDRMPERQRTYARLLNTYAVLAAVTGRTAAARRLIDSITDTWLADGTYLFPKALLVGELDQLDGNDDVARLQFAAALKEVREKLAADPTDLRPVRAELWVQIGLGHREEARAALRINLQRRPKPYHWTMNLTWWTCALRACLLLDERTEALALLKEACAEPVGRLLLRNLFQVDPKMAPFRADPEIQALLAEPVASAPAVLPSTKADEKSVAVLAFTNLSDDKANEYFSDGISEELLNVLAKIPGLKVSARTSAFYFKGKEVPVPEIARQLGVAYVVEGSVRKQGDKVRITAQLIKAADGGFHVWSDTFTRDLKDIFAVQDEIAGLIAQNLELKMGITAARPTIDVEAYQEYLAGRALVAKAGNNDLREAVGHFEKAVALEPKFTAAWVQLASAHTQLGRWGGAPTLQAWAAAHAAIDHAVTLEPDSPDVLLALGWIRRTADWDWRGAEQAFRRALQLRPDHPETLAGAAVLLYNIGRNEEAFRLGQQAIRLDPLNASTQLDLSIMYYLSDNFAEAERTARRALALAPGGAGYHGVLAWGLAGQKRYAEAEAEALLDTDEIQQAVALGLVAIGRGQTEAAHAQVARLEKMARTMGDRADLQNNIAWITAGLGEKDRAFAALEKAQASRDPSVSWLRNGTYLQLLFSDPRWDALLRKAGLADDQLK